MFSDHLCLWRFGAYQSLVECLKKYFDVRLGKLIVESLFVVRDALDRNRWRYAFGDDSRDKPLATNLLWHYSAWYLRHVRDAGLAPHDILKPNNYREVVVLMADLCAYSSYVGGTENDELMRHMITAFYSKARYEILNFGGMLYQVVGDQVIGVFGVPISEKNYIDSALQCARSLTDIGDSISFSWRYKIDRPRV